MKSTNDTLKSLLKTKRQIQVRVALVFIDGIQFVVPILGGFVEKRKKYTRGTK